MTTLQALSGVGEQIAVRAQITDNTALSAALNTQFLLQIGVFTAIPMILGFILEQGFLRVIHIKLSPFISLVGQFVILLFRCCSLFYVILLDV